MGGLFQERRDGAMPEAVTTTPTEPETAPTPAAAQPASAAVESKPEPDEAISDAVGDAGKDAIRKEREARRDLEKKLAESEKLHADLTAKVRQFEDRDKSEHQKLADQVADLQKQVADKEAEVTKAQQQSLRSAVAAEKGVPVTGLTGTTEEELHASADELIAWRDAAAAAKRPPKPPAPTSGLKSGASSTGDHPADPKERAAAALRQLRASGA